MKVQVKDSSGLGFIEAEVEDHRYQAFDRFVQSNAEMLCSSDMAQGLDSTPAMAFLVGQLTYTEANVLTKMRAPTQAAQLIPQDFGAGEAVETIRYEIIDQVGDSDDENPQGNTTPTVEVGYGQQTYGVRGGKVGYKYSQHDLRVAAFMRKPLPEAKLEAAVMTYNRRINNIGLFGKSAYGLEGLFNNSLVPTGSFPTGNWGSGTTAQQMASDLNYLLYLTWIGSAQNEVADTICLPPKAFMMIDSLQMPYSASSALTYFLNNNLLKSKTGRIPTVVSVYGLDTAAPDGGDMAMAYVKDPMHVKQHIPMPLRFLAPQLEDVYINVVGEYRYCGTHIRYINSAVYGYGLVS
jgi:hypothetical protein